jgi:hypothetical protein
MGTMRGRRLALPVLLLATLATPGSTSAAASPRDETLRYRWRLDGLLGAIAGLFVPSGGDGELTLDRLPGGNLQSELTITAPADAGGDYFRYGAEWEPRTGTTVRAWSSQLWRGEHKSKRAEIGDAGIIDVATAIHALRRDPPAGPRSLEIWSDGKLYPVVVLPRGVEERDIDGRRVRARHYAVRPVELPGRRLWKGEMDLWLADDAAATPVEIMVARSSARVRLLLVERVATADSAPGRGEIP